MGFGLLLVGYFFANIMSMTLSLFGFSKLIGYPMMLLALRRLRPYHTRFTPAYFVGYLSLPFAVYYTYTSFGELKALFTGISPSAPPLWLQSTAEWGYFIFCMVFEVLLLLAIGAHSRELGHLKSATPAFRNLIFVAVYGVLYAVAQIPAVANGDAIKFLSIPLTLLRVIYCLLDIWLIFVCYREICPEEEERMEIESLPLSELELLGKGGKHGS